MCIPIAGKQKSELETLLTVFSQVIKYCGKKIRSVDIIRKPKINDIPNYWLLGSRYRRTMAIIEDVLNKIFSNNEEIFQRWHRKLQKYEERNRKFIHIYNIENELKKYFEKNISPKQII